MIPTKDWPLPAADMYHKFVPPVTKNGELNGLTVLLDAEQFNYAYYKAKGPGFKITIDDHRHQPLMKVQSKLLSPGSELQVSQFLPENWYGYHKKEFSTFLMTNRM